MTRQAGIELKALRVDGGPTKNQFLMQFQADLLRATVSRPRCIETTALGAAYLAGLSTGYWDNTEQIKANWSLERKFASQITQVCRDEKLKGWHRAVRCALAWAEDRE